jgi:hypothetical protein
MHVPPLLIRGAESHKAGPSTSNIYAQGAPSSLNDFTSAFQFFCADMHSLPIGTSAAFSAGTGGYSLFTGFRELNPYPPPMGMPFIGRMNRALILPYIL